MNQCEPQVCYSPDDHSYSVDGERWPGVSHILVATGLQSLGFYPDDNAARNFGTGLHEALEAFDLAAKYDEDFIAQVAAWANICQRFGWTFTEIERPSCDPINRVCGRPDRLGNNVDGVPIVVDPKSGGRQRWHGLQLAAYAHMHPAVTSLPREVALANRTAETVLRYSVRFDGIKAVVWHYDDVTDIAYWRAIVATYRVSQLRSLKGYGKKLHQENFA